MRNTNKLALTWKVIFEEQNFAVLSMLLRMLFLADYFCSPNGVFSLESTPVRK